MNLSRLKTAVAQRLFGAARSRRIMMGRDELHDFWRQPQPEGNVPTGFITPVGRSQALLTFLDDLPRQSTVLEVGCNVGRNLNHLAAAGFTSLAGVEISEHAVDLLHATYPALAEADIHVGAAEDILPTLEPFDVVFTMAVLEHIHPDSVGVFDEIARLTTGRLVTIEPRHHLSSRQYPYDVPRIFKARGMRMVDEVVMSDLVDEPALWDYYGQVFEPRLRP